MFFLTSAKFLKVFSRLRKAERTVGSASNKIGIFNILTVIFPKTHRTNFIAAALVQRLITTARTSIRDSFLLRHKNGVILKFINIGFKPFFALF